MHQINLLNAKFLVPRQRTNSLPRPHLVERLNGFMNKRLILLSAPPGYGKSTLLVDFIVQCRLPYSWYQLNESDSDPMTFLRYFANCLQQVKGTVAESETSISNDVIDVMFQQSEEDTSTLSERILTTLINDLIDSSLNDFLIVLEDYHVIANATVHNLVKLLLEHSPPELHLILSSRNDPPFPLARLRARGLLGELRTADLRFQNHEIRNLLENQLPTIQSEDIQLIQQKTEGWAAAIQMMMTSFTNLKIESADQNFFNLQGSNRHIFDFLAEEIFKRQSSARKYFLMATTIFDQFNASLCKLLLGIENPQTFIDKTVDDNLFLISLDEHNNWYRYHHLFHAFLSSRFQRTEPKLYKQLNEQAGLYFEQLGNLETAFQHFVRAQTFDNASRILVDLSSELIEQGQVTAIQHYMGQIPASYFDAYPSLFLRRGIALRRLGEIGSAIICLENARALFEERQESLMVCQALTQMARLTYAQGDYNRARKLSENALEFAQDDLVSRTLALMALAKSESFLTGMKRGRKLAEEAVATAQQVGQAITSRRKANLLRSLSQICWWHGDPFSAIRYGEEALKISPDTLSPALAEVFLALVAPYMYLHELDKAQFYAEQALEIIQRLELVERTPFANALLGAVLTRRGEFARAEIILRQSVELAEKYSLANHTRVMAVGYLVQNLRGQSRHVEAQQLAESAYWTQGVNDNSYEIYFYRGILADITLANGRIEDAKSLYESLIMLGEERQFRIPLAMNHFALSYIYFKLGNKVKGINYALKSLEFVETNGMIQLYIDQGEWAQTVCKELWQNGKRSLFVKRVLDMLPHAPALQPPVSIVNKTAVRVECLGQFRVFVGGEEVTHAQWTSLKSRDLLAYFITFRHESVLTDRVYDAIWPGNSEMSRNALHTAISRLRKALRRPDQKTRFILIEAGEYHLDLARFQIDVDEFEQTLTQAQNSNDRDSILLYEHALSLYKGEFLQNLSPYDWLLPERRYLENTYITTLQHLSDLYADLARYEEALELLNRIINIDPLREEIHCLIMRHHASMGNKVGIIRQFRQLAEVLERELHSTPLDSTRELYQSLLNTF